MTPVARPLRWVVGVLLVAAVGCASSRPVVEVAGPRLVGGLHGTQVGDVIGRPDLVLRDTAGHRFSLRTRPVGELTVLFFGYTHCPDVCPTTMADLAAARRLLPVKVRPQVHVVFVTEDPRRDTAAVLRTWLDRFDTSFTGLIGGGVATRGVLDALKAPETNAASELVEHSGSVYAFVGSRVVVYTGGTTPTEFAQDFTTLLRGT